MKKITLIVSMLFCSFLHAQVINFEDENFKAKLLLSASNNGIARGITGSQMRIDANNDGEIQESEALAVYKLDVSSSNLIDITQISYFTNLTELKCAYNPQLTSPLNLTNHHALKKLDSGATLIPSLNITNLSQLETIDMMGNSLTTLDLTGLTSLRWADLRMSKFQSVTISNLPNLYMLNLTFCTLLTSVTLTDLPSLSFFECSDSNLSDINLYNLPNLQHLGFMRNNVTALDVNSLTGLKEINCSDNQISNLNISALSNLTQLQVTNNVLTSLDVSNNPGLTEMSCARNQLTSLVVGDKPNLRWLTCSYNQINSLQLSNLPALYYINCENNQIAELPNLNEFHTLGALNCNDNIIGTLDVSEITNLTSLEADSNHLTRLFIKNGSAATTLNIASNPNLQYICADDIDIPSLEPYLASMPSCVVNSYCSFVPGGTLYTINGKQHFDLNGNGCDSADVAIPNLMFNLNVGGANFTFIGNAAGAFEMPVQAGSYLVSPIIEHPEYFTVSPQVSTVVFPSEENPSNTEFCIKPNGLHHDLEVNILPTSIARPGFDATYKIVYKNNGNTMQSGTVVLDFLNDRIDLVSSVPPVSVQEGDHLSWDYVNLFPFEKREITIRLNLNSTVESPSINGGDWLEFGALITPVDIDEYYQDNHSELKQLVVNSFDPNDKVCAEGNVVRPEIIGKDVHYIIRFENTGTANAESIVVKDMIDIAKFDISSLVSLDGSHPFVTKISNTNKVEFIFENINLPFDNESNDGYVAFKIKTRPTLVLGDTFTNNASIYFDYNAAILTNNATTTIQLLATQDYDFADYFEVYPNPASTILNINSKKQIGINSIAIYNVLGQLVITIPNAQQVSTIDISDLKTGNYFIKINSDKGTTNAKFAKN